MGELKNRVLGAYFFFCPAALTLLSQAVVNAVAGLGGCGGQKEILELLSFPVCVCLALRSAPFVLCSTMGPRSAPGRPRPARLNRDTRWSLMCAALREKRRHVLLLLRGPAASLSA